MKSMYFDFRPEHTVFTIVSSLNLYGLDGNTVNKMVKLAWGKTDPCVLSASKTPDLLSALKFVLDMTYLPKI